MQKKKPDKSRNEPDAYLIFDGPFVWKGSEVSQVLHSPVQVMLVPEQHAEGLLCVVAILFFRHLDVLVHWKHSHHQSMKCSVLTFHQSTYVWSETICRWGTRQEEPSPGIGQVSSLQNKKEDRENVTTFIFTNLTDEKGSRKVAYVRAV